MSLTVRGGKNPKTDKTFFAARIGTDAVRFNPTGCLNLCTDFPAMKPLWNKLQHAPRFKEEIDLWLTEGIITEAQAQELIRRYGLDLPPPWYMQSGRLLRGIGLAVAATGFLLLIAENWQHLPIFLQIMTGLLPLAASYAIAWHGHIKSRAQQPESAMLFGTLLLGVNIWLQAQIFHISTYYPDGLLWWIIGALPVIFWFRNKILHFLFTALASVWLGLQLEYEQFSLWAVPIVGLLLYMEYLKPNAWTLLACIVSVIWFFAGLLTYERYYFNRANLLDTDTAVMFAAACCILFLVIFQKIKHHYGERTAWLLESSAMLFFAALFFTLNFKAPLQDFVRSAAATPLPLTVWVMIIAAVVLFGFNIKQNKGVLFYVGAFVLMLISCIASPLTFSKQDEYFTDFYFILMNAGFVLFAMAHILSAVVVTGRKGTFMSGVFFLTVWLLGRYVALSEDYLITAIMFIGFGAVIYYLSSWWDKRLNRSNR